MRSATQPITRPWRTFAGAYGLHLDRRVQRLYGAAGGVPFAIACQAEVVLEERFTLGMQAQADARLSFCVWPRPEMPPLYVWPTRECIATGDATFDAAFSVLTTTRRARFAFEVVNTRVRDLLAGLDGARLIVRRGAVVLLFSSLNDDSFHRARKIIADLCQPRSHRF
jgi:hypothetical protein